MISPYTLMGQDANKGEGMKLSFSPLRGSLSPTLSNMNSNALIIISSMKH